MLKLLIVDDEVFVRLGLKSTIDWSSIGYEIVGEAEDGQKAIEISRDTHPDVVLTDISMPKMNGLELIKALKFELPNTKVVVLSCYGDYEYVREAMQLWGALDYLLKLSAGPEELMKVMGRVKEVIVQENIRDEKSMELQWQIKSNLRDIRSKFFNDLLDGTVNDLLKMDSQLKLLDIKAQECNYVVMCMLLDNFHTMIMKSGRLGGLKLLSFSIMDIIDELLNSCGFSGCIFHRKDREFGILIESDRFIGISISKITNLCLRIKSALSEYLNISASFGAGSEEISLTKLYEAYPMVLQTAKYGFYDVPGGIYFSADILPYGNGDHYNGKIESSLRLLLEEANQAGVKSIINGIVDSIIADHPLPSRVTDECKEIVNTFSSVIRQFNRSINEIKDSHGDCPMDSLEHCESLQQIKEWFHWFIGEYAVFLKKIKGQNYKSEITKAIEYINDNYANSIMLKDIADYVHINETYLSSLFKKETGQNFTDFLNAFKVNKAKEILRKADVSVSEAGEMVGYGSLSYFSRVFKELTGLNPVDYKKNMKKV